MRVRASIAWLPKAGNSDDDYEDAFWPERSIDRSGPSFRFAVADGATEASFSRLWARMLVAAYGRRRLNTRALDRALLPLQERWQADVAARPLPWYAEEKALSGAFSSLAGLQVREGATWRAVAVGDSCLLQVRGASLITTFPMGSADEFNSRPHLIGSRPSANRALQAEVRSRSGRWEEGDRFFLMSDAVACWFMRSAEEGGRPWCEVEQAMCEACFAQWVGQQRAVGTMRNDDVTVLRIEMFA